MIDPGASRSGKSALEIAITVARAAGEVILDRFRQAHDVEYKGRGNVVTEADLLSERTMMDMLRQEYPEHGIMTEESEGVASASGFCWVLDPIDGTRNYASGVPHFGLNIALTYAEQPIIAVTFDPMRRDLFTAEKGKGAYCNGARLAASQSPNLLQSVFGLDMGYQSGAARHALEMLLALWPGMQTCRVMGSAALGMAYAAAGHLDLYIHHDLRPWDVVCGLLLVPEAGGVITDRGGGPAGLHSTGVISGGPAVHADFLRLTDGMAWRQM